MLRVDNKLYFLNASVYLNRFYRFRLLVVFLFWFVFRDTNFWTTSNRIDKRYHFHSGQRP